MEFKRQAIPTHPRHLRSPLQILAMVLLVILLLLSLSGKTAAEARPLANTKVELEPSDGVLLDSRTVTVRARYVIEMIGYQFRLTFDPNLLEVVDLRPGSIFEGKQYMVFPTIDNEHGVVTYVVTLFQQGVSVSGSGSLAQIVFRAKGLGRSELVFDRQYSALKRRPTQFDPNPVMETDWLDGSLTAIEGMQLFLPYLADNAPTAGS